MLNRQVDVGVWGSVDAKELGHMQRLSGSELLSLWTARYGG